MERFCPILFHVWREACRHIEIQESAAAIADLLAKQMPLDQILVRRLDVEHATIATVATAPAKPDSPVSEDRRHFTPPELRRVLSWYKSGSLLRRGTRITNLLGLLLPGGISADLLAAPLVSSDFPIGLLVATARRGRVFGEVHVELLDALREPFSAALENDRRIHEMASLRQAAEADRGALLRRLGRTELVVDTVIGEQTGLRQVIQRVDLVSGSDVPVLIMGETGTGKELIARRIHTHSPRRAGPFLRVNCGAIPAELIDSQLFGHERGSFTGAERSRQGWFERADGGTLFLDEIGELPLEAQVRFLRVLQDGFIERVGGDQPIHVDVRIVAATHRDLALMVRDNRFREDLWYRLAVFPILLPPLRERREDILALAAHFAERAAIRFGLAPVPPTDEDIRLFQTYDWPGNIRELGTVIDRAAILGDGRSLEVAKALGFSGGTPAARAAEIPFRSASQPSEADHPVASLDEAMRAHIESVLRLTGGRIEGRRGAAALLEINPHTLRARMRKLGIDWAQFRTVDR